MTNETEMWVHLVEYPGYYFSNSGRLYRIRCVSTFYHYKSKNRPHKFLSPGLASEYPGYSVSVSNKRSFLMIHRLLAIHFIPNPNNLPQVNHIDGNKLNYALSNLEWTSVRDNVLHAQRAGLITYKRKDTKVMDRIDEIKEMHRNGMSRRAIQMEVGCSQSGIQRLFRYKLLTA